MLKFAAAHPFVSLFLGSWAIFIVAGLVAGLVNSWKYHRARRAIFLDRSHGLED